MLTSALRRIKRWETQKFAARREALLKSAEEIERAKRLLRETEELNDIPSVSQPNDKAS